MGENGLRLAHSPDHARNAGRPGLSEYAGRVPVLRPRLRSRTQIRLRVQGADQGGIKDGAPKHMGEVAEDGMRRRQAGYTWFHNATRHRAGMRGGLTTEGNARTRNTHSKRALAAMDRQEDERALFIVPGQDAPGHAASKAHRGGSPNRHAATRQRRERAATTPRLSGRACLPPSSAR